MGNYPPNNYPPVNGLGLDRQQVGVWACTNRFSGPPYPPKRPYEFFFFKHLMSSGFRVLLIRV